MLTLKIFTNHFPIFDLGTISDLKLQEAKLFLLKIIFRNQFISKTLREINFHNILSELILYSE